MHCFDRISVLGQCHPDGSAYTKEPMLWKIMSKVFGMLRHFTAMSKVPAEGKYFKLHLIADHALVSGYEDAMEEILGYSNNIL